MVELMRRAFRNLFSVIVVFLMLGAIISGFIYMNDNPLIGLLGIVIGVIFVILLTGVVATFLNIDMNLEKLVEQGLIVSKNNSNKFGVDNIKKCPFCKEEIKKEAIICKYCGRNIEEYENDKKLKAEQEKLGKQKAKSEKFKSLEDLFNDKEIMEEAKKLRRLYGKGMDISHLKHKAKELGLGEIDINPEDIE